MRVEQSTCTTNMLCNQRKNKLSDHTPRHIKHMKLLSEKYSQLSFFFFLKSSGGWGKIKL